jgi:arylsulfatase
VIRLPLGCRSPAGTVHAMHYLPAMHPQRAPCAAVRLRRAASRTALVAALLAGCADRAPPPDLPDVLLVTLDTTRADHLGCYGYFRDTSPTIDALARESIVFERMLVPMATTLPTHVSILTATAPLEHGVLANTTQGGERFVPSPRLQSFAALAAAAGYRTAAFVSATPLKRGSGIEAGFETFDEPRARQRDARATADAALAWLSDLDDTPFFLWVHFYDAHWPFAPPAPYDELYHTDEALEAYLAERQVPDRAPRPLVGTIDDARISTNAYDGEIRYQDAHLARLIARLRESGRWERTALVLAGDHGEGLCQHGEAAHGGTWNEQLHAPMMIRVPGIEPRRVATPLTAADALPTLLGLLAVPQLAFPDGQASGRNALAPGYEPGAILGQDTGRARDGPYRVAVTADRWKYFRIEEPGGAVRELLFDLEADPHELRDVSAARPEVVHRLRAALEERIASQSARGAALRDGREPETRPVDPETLDQLRALGYAVGE